MAKSAEGSSAADRACNGPERAARSNERTNSNWRCPIAAHHGLKCSEDDVHGEKTYRDISALK